MQDFNIYDAYTTTINATATLISTALVVVVGFNWSETIKQGIDETWPKENVFKQKLLLSIILTLLVVILITFIFPIAFPNAVATQLVKKT